MQGAPTTEHVTSPTSWLSSVIVNVLEMVPRISAAEAELLPTNTPKHTTAASGLLPRIPHLLVEFNDPETSAYRPAGWNTSGTENVITPLRRMSVT